MKKNNILYTGLAACVILIASSCSDYLDINDNPNYPANAPESALLPSGLIGTAARLGSDYQLYGGMWMQHYTQGHTSNQYNNMVNFTQTNASSNGMWTTPYSVALPDLDLLIKKSEISKSWNYWAMAKVMTAFNYHILVDTYGAIPFTQALRAEEFSNPIYDDSKTVVYPGILAMLDEVIAKKADVLGDNLPVINNADYVFGGDLSKWIAFAKSLKLKLYMRDFETNKSSIQTLLQEDELLNKDAKIDVFQDLENKSNPLYENDRRKLNTGNNIRACLTLSNFLIKNNDPRQYVFYNLNSDNEVVGLKLGERPSSSLVPSGKISIVKLEAKDPVYFMSAAEVFFLKAEAYARLGNVAKAKEAYDMALNEAFNRWNLDAANFIASGGLYEFDSSSLESMLTSIIVQKWIASTRCQAWDAWFDFNRTGMPKLGTTFTDDDDYILGHLTPCIGSALALGEFPRRMMFPKASSDYNSNAPEVLPLTTKMWWHK